MRFSLLPALTILALPLFAHAAGTDFVPLLPSLPGLTETRDATSLAPFLSQVYKICIGLAAVLAVLQLMRAGVMYMGGDSITEKKDARALIGTSLAGLLLVLSPVIVFSIINPKILNLDISAGNLQSTPATGSPAAPAVKTDNGGADLGNGVVAPPSKIKATGAVNPGCKPIASGQIIPWEDTQAATCCQYQESATVTCNTEAKSSGTTSTQYCLCKNK